MSNASQSNGVTTSNETPVYLDDIDYCESSALTMLGGFLIIFENQRRITINARLTAQQKARGRDHLLQHLHTVATAPVAMYLWVCDEEDPAP